MNKTIAAALLCGTLTGCASTAQLVMEYPATELCYQAIQGKQYIEYSNELRRRGFTTCSPEAIAEGKRQNAERTERAALALAGLAVGLINVTAEQYQPKPVIAAQRPLNCTSVRNGNIINTTCH